jgi:hypothetical protein
LKELNISFWENDNAFLAVSDPQALQDATDRLSPEIIRNRLEYWTLVLGPKFSKRERRGIILSRFYALTQVEYCRNLIFKHRFPIRKDATQTNYSLDIVKCSLLGLCYLKHEAFMKCPVTLNQESYLICKEHMWNIGRRTDPSHISLARILEGSLNVEALERALNAAIERHAGLRAAFVPMGDLMPSEREKKIYDLADQSAVTTGMYAMYPIETTPIQIQINFIEFLAPEEQDIEIENILRSSYKTPFDYSRPPFVRPHLFQLSSDRHLLVLILDHLVCDLYSLVLFAGDVTAFYKSFISGDTARLPAIRKNFLDFALEQYEQAAGGGFDNSIRYWKDQWEQCQTAPLFWENVPARFRGAAEPNDDGIGAESVNLDFMESCETFAKKKKISLFTLYLTACLSVFKKLNKNKAISVASNLANKTNIDYLNAVGFFSNLHFLGVEFSDSSTVNDVLSMVRTNVLGAITHQSVPLPLLMNITGMRPHSGDVSIICDMLPSNRYNILKNQSNPVTFRTIPMPDYMLANLGESMTFRLFHTGNGGVIAATFPSDKLGNDGALSILKEIRNMMRWCIENEYEPVVNYKIDT